LSAVFIVISVAGYQEIAADGRHADNDEYRRQSGSLRQLTNQFTEVMINLIYRRTSGRLHSAVSRPPFR